MGSADSGPGLVSGPEAGLGPSTGSSPVVAHGGVFQCVEPATMGLVFQQRGSSPVRSDLAGGCLFFSPQPLVSDPAFIAGVALVSASEVVVQHSPATKSIEGVWQGGFLPLSIGLGVALFSLCRLLQ